MRGEMRGGGKMGKQERIQILGDEMIHRVEGLDIHEAVRQIAVMHSLDIDRIKNSVADKLDVVMDMNPSLQRDVVESLLAMGKLLQIVLGVEISEGRYMNCPPRDMIADAVRKAQRSVRRAGYREAVKKYGEEYVKKKINEGRRNGKK